MKKFKIAGIIIASLIILIYIAFLTVVPNLINLNNYKSNIQTLIKDNAGLTTDFDNLSYATTPDFGLKIKLQNLDVKYPDGKNVLKVGYADAKIPLFPLLLKTFKISALNFNNSDIFLEIDKNGHYNLEKYILEKIANTNETQPETNNSLPVTFSAQMPKISLKNYSVIFDDAENKTVSTIKGELIKIEDFDLNKNIKITAIGELNENEQKRITYDIKISSFLPQSQENNKNDEFKLPDELFNPFKQIAKYDLNANIVSDLKITNEKDKTHINGFLNVDNLQFKSSGVMLPESYMHLSFKNDDIKINSDFYSAKNEKTNINGDLNFGKKPNIKLSVKNGGVKISNLKSIAIIIFDVLNIKNDLKNLNTEGYITADFTIETDYKKINSDGKLMLKEGNITHKKLPVKISNIKALLNFSDNKIIISDTNANINGSSVNITGTIDNSANADIKINANKLPLAKLYATFATPNLQQLYAVNSGELTLNGYIKGELSKISPTIDVILNNMEIKDKGTNATYKLSELKSNILAQNDKFNGDAKLTGIKINFPQYNIHLNAPSANILINNKDIEIKPVIINLDNSKLTFDGKATDYMTNMNFDGVIKGNLNTNSLKSYLPKDIQAMTKNSGNLPMITLITSNGKTTQISAQVLANAQNYFSPIEIDEMKYHNSILNVDISASNDNLSIKDIGLYSLNNNSELSNNLKTNITNSSQIIYISGKINQISSNNPVLSGIKAATSKNISINIPTLTNSTATINANINADGNVNSPNIKGQAVFRNVSIPTYMLKANDFNVNFDKTAINGNCSNLNLNGSPISLSFNANSDFSKNFVINNLNFNSTYFDLDKILEITANMPQANYAASVSLPVKILKGSATISKFLTGGIEASNASANFTLNNDVLSLTNVKASAYQGTLSGSINYNIAYLTLKAKLQGAAMDANKAITAFLGLKDQITGTLGFNADISMTGSNQTQQLRTLKGNANFNIQNGQMGNLGKMEYYLHAQNLIASKLFNINLNSLLNAISPKNTGKISYLKGDLTFKNGYVYIFPVTSSGPNMSLYMEGSFNLLNNLANIELLGRLSQDVHKSLGVVGDLSLSKILSTGNTKFGTAAAAVLQNYNMQTSTSQINKIPSLTPPASDTKEFAVQIQGNIESASSVKSFKWLTTQNISASSQALQIKVPTAIQKMSDKIQQTTTKTQSSGISNGKTTTSGYATQRTNKQTEIPDFIKALPDTFKQKNNN